MISTHSRDLVLFGVGEDGLESLEVGVDITEDGNAHCQGLEAGGI
jgi:hypothetical protein